MPNQRKEGQKKLSVWIDETLYYSVFRASDEDSNISQFTRDALEEKLERDNPQSQVAPTHK